MTFPASQIGLLISGRIEGDPNTLVDSFGKIEEAVEIAKQADVIVLFVGGMKVQVVKAGQQII